MEKIEKTIGIYIWQNMATLDASGPHQFLGYVPGFKVVTISKTMDPVASDTGVRLIPDHDFATCPALDILMVAGGVNPLPEMQDESVISFLRRAGDSAEYVTSVCTGSLILAQAGLLNGYRATTHWAYQERLALYPGVEVVASRVVTDRNRMTSAGVTASIDFVLTLIRQVAGPETAAGLQLMTEYDPQPPTNVGSPNSAPPELVAAARQQFDQMTPDLAEFFAAKAGK